MPMSSRARPAGPTRRQRGRAAAIDEIKAAALDELRLHGAGGVTMRGVARAIDMTPSGLYRYFDDHGALLAALCVDAHESLRTALVREEGGHPDDDSTARWFRGSLVLRRWALGHPDEFSLIVGPRPPGVAADQPDIHRASARLLAVPVATIAQAIAAGDLTPAPVDPSMRLVSPAADDGTRAEAIAVAAISALVGAVSLEAFGHLVRADAEDAYGAYSLHVMRGMGFASTPDRGLVVLAAS